MELTSSQVPVPIWISTSVGRWAFQDQGGGCEAHELGIRAHAFTPCVRPFELESHESQKSLKRIENTAQRLLGERPQRHVYSFNTYVREREIYRERETEVNIEMEMEMEIEMCQSQTMSLNLRLGKVRETWSPRGRNHHPPKGVRRGGSQHKITAAF